MFFSFEVLVKNVIQQTSAVQWDCTKKIRDVFDFLFHFPAAKAAELLQAFQPLVQRTDILKNSLMLIMRKAMFSRELDGRTVALNFFLSCLKNSHNMRLLTSSQGSAASEFSQVKYLWCSRITPFLKDDNFNICKYFKYRVDVHSSMKPAESEAFCLEILELVRRAVMQQADIRVLLYKVNYDKLCIKL